MKQICFLLSVAALSSVILVLFLLFCSPLCHEYTCGFSLHLILPLCPWKSQSPHAYLEKSVPMNFKVQLESHLLLEPFPKHLSLSPSALLQHPGWYCIYCSLSLFLITRILCVYLISPTRL